MTGIIGINGLPTGCCGCLLAPFTELLGVIRWKAFIHAFRGLHAGAGFAVEAIRFSHAGFDVWKAFQFQPM